MCQSIEQKLLCHHFSFSHSLIRFALTVKPPRAHLIPIGQSQIALSVSQEHIRNCNEMKSPALISLLDQ